MEKKKILIVENEGVVARSLKSSLEKMGYEVAAPVFSGEEAIEKAGELCPDLILMDVVLRGDMNGIEAADKIHKDFDIPSIYLATSADEEMLRQAKVTKSYEYILKPYMERELRINTEIAIYRIEADEELKRSEERYRTVFENTGTATAVIEEDTTVSMVNHEMELLSVFSKEEVEGKKRWTEFVVREDLEKMKEYHKLRRDNPESAPRNYEFGLIDKRGNIINILLTISMVPDTKTSIASLLDITEQKRAMAALSEANSIINRSPAVAFLWENEEGWPVEFVSENIDKLTGYSSQEFVEGKMPYIDIIHKDDLKRVATEVANYSNRKRMQTFTHKPYRIVTKDGDIKWIDDTTYIRRDSQGTITHYEGIVQDITRRKKVEEELELRAEMLNQSRDGFMVHDLNGNFIYANDTVLKERGYTRDEFLKMNVSDLVTARHYSKVKRWWQDSTDKKDRTEEVDIYRKDGTWFPVEVNTSKASFGGHEYILCTTRDISERKKAEEELKLRAEMLDSASDAIILEELDGNFTYANETALKQRGYTLEQFIKMNAYDIASPEYAMEIKKHVKQVRDTGQASWEQDVYCHNGTLLPVEVKATLIRFQGKDYVLIVARDITERKKIEEELKLRAEMLDQASSGIILSDLEGNFIYANNVAFRERGYSRDKFLRMNVKDIVVPLDNRSVDEWWHQVLEKGYFKGEFEVVRRNTTRMPVEAILTKINLSDKDYVISVAQDISERKKAEEALRNSEERLNKFMNSATDAFTIYDSELNLIDCNETRMKMYFSRLKKEEVIGKNLLDILPRLRGTDRYARMQEVMKTGKPFIDDDTISYADKASLPESERRHISFRAFKVGNGLGVISTDITERKKAEEKLKANEKELEMLLEHLPGMVFYKDSNFKYRRVNPAFTKLHRITQEEIIGKTISELSLQNAELADIDDREIIERSQGSTRIIEFPDLTGGSRWQQITKTPIFDDKGSFKGILGVGVDITEMVRAEEELKLRAEMLDQSGDAIMLQDKDRNFVYVNQTALTERGYSRDEFFQLKGGSLIIPAERGIHSKWRQDIKKWGRAQAEWHIVRKDGTIFPVEVVGTMISSGTDKYILSVARDITERKKAEAELKIRAEMLDQATDGILLHDMNGKYIYVNETAAEERGYSREELMRMNVKDLLSAQFYNQQKKWWEKVKDGEHQRTEYETRCKDGTLIPIDSNITRIQYEDKKYMLVVTRDITERKRIEAERAELEKKAQVASRLASVGEMASGIAHEINNPLTGVIGFAQLLSDRKDLPEDVMDQLSVIQEGGQRVSSIVKRLLTFARQSKLERTYININDILENTLKLRSYALATGNIEIATRLEPGLPDTMADAGQLQQVFLNLIVNAEQEMEKAHSGGRLEVKTEYRGDIIRVLFKDDGPGIAKEDLDKVFDPFFTTKEVGEGTGLGLSLSHGIMAEHGGRLYVESKEGKGATFTVEIPVTTEGRQYKLTEAVDEERGEHKSGRILVVDDEEIVGSYLKRVLGAEGHEVEVETEAGKALERLERESYDLILSDIKMPGMGGIEFYQNIKKMKESLAEKVVFITGDVIGKETRNFLEETGLPNITKPINVKQLKETINRVMNI